MNNDLNIIFLYTKDFSGEVSIRTDRAKVIETPTINRKNGNTVSVYVQPCHSACRKGA